MKKLIIFLTLIDNYGWKIFISFIFPVYWSQDAKFHNNGYDIITLRKSKTSYSYATYWKNNT